MIATTKAVELWLRHATGVEKLNVPEGLVRVTEAVELNKDPIPILSTFGKKEFAAIVGFIDMRGFSGRSRGLCPTEVAALVRPFITAVVDAAARHQCFIDKTIGDEVMLIMPEFGEDAVCSDAGIEHRDSMILSLGSLIADIAKATRAIEPPVRFSSGFAYGRLILDRIGASAYQEWTCYGNVVNAAKRIQAEGNRGGAPDSDLLAIGAIDADEPGWADEVRAWANMHDQVGPLTLIKPLVETTDLKGVGLTTFLSCQVAPHEWLS